MLHKSMQWGLVLSLVGGLSSCAMDNQQNQGGDQSTMVYPQPATQIKPVATASKVSSGSNESLQKAVPGPKRAAAPQLPVIQ
jgi:hypothetical protein